MRSVKLAGSFLLLFFNPDAMAAHIYKWVDAQGITYFGAHPPAGQTAETVSTGSAMPHHAIPLMPPKEQAPSSQADPQRAIDRQVKNRVIAEEAERKEYCTKLRTDLAQMKINPRIHIEEEGKVRRITEEERQTRMSESEKRITENCQ